MRFEKIKKLQTQLNVFGILPYYFCEFAYCFGRVRFERLELLVECVFGYELLECMSFLAFNQFADTCCVLGCNYLRHDRCPEFVRYLACL